MSGLSNGELARCMRTFEVARKCCKAIDFPIRGVNGGQGSLY